MVRAFMLLCSLNLSAQVVDTVDAEVFFIKDTCCYTSPTMVKNVPLMTEGTVDMLFYMDVKTREWSPSRDFVFIRDEKVYILHPF